MESSLSPHTPQMLQHLATWSTFVKVIAHVPILWPRGYQCTLVFAVFNLFPTWTWSHLPDSLTQAPHMTIDVVITQPVNEIGRKTSVDITSENEYRPTDSHSECKNPSSSGMTKTGIQPVPEKTYSADSYSYYCQ